MAGPLLDDRINLSLVGFTPESGKVAGRGVEPMGVAPTPEQMREKIALAAAALDAERASAQQPLPDTAPEPPTPAPTPSVPQEQPPGVPATQEPEPPEPVFDPGRYTIADVRQHLAEHPDQWAAVTAAEKAGRHRVRLLAWLAERADDGLNTEPAGDGAEDELSEENGS